MKRLFLIALFMLFSLQIASAQETSLVGRLFYLWDGDIYSWLPGETEPIRHTTGRRHDDLAISPDGMMLTYTHTPDSVSDELYDPYYDTKDIWAWDLRMDTLIPIAVHPSDADTPEEWLSRSGATWSPDGTRLAYSEWEFPRLDIMVYDFRDGTTSPFSDKVGFGYADGSEHQDQRVDWGGTISKTVWTYYDDQQGAGYELSLYNDDGGLCAYGLDQSIDPAYGAPPEVRFASWVLMEDTWYIGLEYKDAVPFRLMDYHTGEQFAPESSPRFTVMNPGADAIRAAWSLNAAGDVGWSVEWASGESDFIEGSQLVFSPNADQIAVTRREEDRWTITVMEDGDVIDTFEQPNPEGIYWQSGGIEWAYAVSQYEALVEMTPVEPYLDVVKCFE